MMPEDRIYQLEKHLKILARRPNKTEKTLEHIAGKKRELEIWKKIVNCTGYCGHCEMCRVMP